MIADFQYVCMRNHTCLKQGYFLRELHIACQEDTAASALRQQDERIIVFFLFIPFKRPQDGQLASVQRKGISGGQEDNLLPRAFQGFDCRMLVFFLFY